jgi:fumarylpyruvate hydrolase
LTQLFETPAPVLAKTSDGHDYPVRRIFCIGRNYADHAKEMGVEVDREAPFYFTKWAETVIPSGSTMAYPPMTSNFHYEAELVVAIGKGGRNIDEAQAADHIYGYATGLDMTRRDLQLEARGKGRPWDAGKNVEQSSPLGLLHPIAETGELTKGNIRLTVNGEVKQNADLSDLIHSIPALIAYISQAYRLEPGDLIYTGTPAGVGAVVPGDEIVVSVEDLSDTVVKVGPPLDE